MDGRIAIVKYQLQHVVISNAKYQNTNNLVIEGRTLLNEQIQISTN